MPIEPFVDHGMSQLLRLVAATIYGFSGAFNVPWKNGYDPSVSLDGSTDGVSDTSVLHRGIVRPYWELSNRFPRVRSETAVRRAGVSSKRF
jgi:hypothetical protein